MSSAKFPDFSIIFQLDSLERMRVFLSPFNLFLSFSHHERRYIFVRVLNLEKLLGEIIAAKLSFFRVRNFHISGCCNGIAFIDFLLLLVFSHLGLQYLFCEIHHVEFNYQISAIQFFKKLIIFQLVLLQNFPEDVIGDYH